MKGGIIGQVMQPHHYSPAGAAPAHYIILYFRWQFGWQCANGGMDYCHIQGSPPTYMVFTNEDLTTSILGLCMRKWGIFVLVSGPPTVPLTWILCMAVTLCIE